MLLCFKALPSLLIRLDRFSSPQHSMHIGMLAGLQLPAVQQQSACGCLPRKNALLLVSTAAAASRGQQGGEGRTDRPQEVMPPGMEVSWRQL